MELSSDVVEISYAVLLNHIDYRMRTNVRRFQNPGRRIGLIKRLSDSLTATVARKYIDCENSRALIDPEALNHHEKPHHRASVVRRELNARHA